MSALNYDMENTLKDKKACHSLLVCVGNVTSCKIFIL